MKNMLALMLVPLALASCSTTPTPQSTLVKAQFLNLPDPSCIVQDGANFSPSTIYVNRSPAPSYPNTGVDVQFGSTNTATVYMRLLPPNGINVSWAVQSASGSKTSGSTQRFPLLVSASPALAPGQYTLPMQVTTNYNQNTWCPKRLLTVYVR